MASSHATLAPADDVPGLAARRAAATLIADVLKGAGTLDDAAERVALPGPDKALARAIATAAFRRLGSIRRVLGERLERGMPRGGGPLEAILLAGAAQLLFLDVPDHAAVDLAIRHLHEDPRSARYAALGNALLRRLARERDAVLAGLDPLDDVPDWLRASWTARYGATAAAAIARAHAEEPPLDLTVKSDPERWAKELDGLVLPTGSVRLRGREAITGLPGFAEGQWWVQDAAAALPARLLDLRPGERVADLCAAPGGKTAQLAQAGAHVTAVDRSAPRLRRLEANLGRLGLAAGLVSADATAFAAEPFDAVLLDAPCSATGTVRRHPEVAWTKTPQDVAKLAALQARLLDRAARLVRPGGRLLYCTCSLEREEGEAQIEAFLARTPGLARDPIRPMEIGGLAEALTPLGELRTLPHQLAGETPRLSGWAGFYACRLIRL